MIIIGNRRDGDEGEYVGRPSPLGNPFAVENGGRDAACDRYDAWFAEVARERAGLAPGRSRRVLRELERLRDLRRQTGRLVLVCWCEPLRCHAETIKRWLEANP